MRIGYYIPGWPPGSVPNGIVSYLGNLGRQLRELGHDVFYIAPSGAVHEHDRWVTALDPIKPKNFLERVRFKLSFEDAFFRAVSGGIADAAQKLVEEEGLDIFQMEETQGWARTVIDRVSIPVVVRHHGPWFLIGALAPQTDAKPENRHRIEREGEAIRHAAGLTAPSKNVLELSARFYGQPKCPTAVIPNAIPATPEPTYWRLDTCDPDTILFVGRFDNVKGADLLMRAFAKLVPARQKLKLVFVGPDFGVTSKSGHLTKFAEFLDREIPSAIRNRIEYCGVMPHQKIHRLRLGAYLTVVCSRFENFPNAVMEAMAVGCPVVATNVGGIPEMLIDNRNGLLAPGEDVDGLAETIARLLDDHDLARRLGAQAAQDCKEWFDAKALAQRTIDFYSLVIERHKQLRGS